MFPLLLFAFTLAVLPLVSTRVAAVLTVLTYLSVLFFKIKPTRQALTFSVLATIALTTASLINKNLPTSLTLLQWIILIWSVPLFSTLINKYGRRTLVTTVLIIISAHAVWGIGQFVLQRDLGLTRLGESKINIYQPAVAKLELPYAPFKLLRAYGPYKHANSFAGVLVLGVSLFGVLRRPKPWRRLEVLIFFLLSLALFTTFSRAAIFSFLLLLIFNAKIFFKLKYFLLIAVLVLTFFPLMFYRFSFTGGKDKAVPERISSVQWASEVIKENNFWKGTGIGHYPSALKNYLDSRDINYQPWQIDFAHSVPILLVAEWGIVANLLLFTAFATLLNKKTSLLLLALTPILLTDHYFVTQLSPALFLLLVLTLHQEVALPNVPPYANAAPLEVKQPE
jgi:hypothetical protein